MSIIGGASQGGLVDTGDIGHSLRFRASNSAYLGKAYVAGVAAPDSSNLIKTFSLWVKRGGLGANQDIFSHYATDINQYAIVFDTSDRLVLLSVISGATTTQLVSDAVFRDPLAWLHIVVSVDTTQATASDRIKVWVNNSQITSWATATYPGLNAWSLNFLTPVGGTWNAAFGRRGNGSLYFGGYLARACVIDGQALTPDSFGYLNSDSNVWVTKSQAAVKAVVDAGGANSFMLDFDDGTSLTTLGYDKSSKGNNWTLNNFSLTAGPTYDWMLDTPSNNFATLNNIYPSAANITNGNLSSGTTAVRGTFNSTVFDSQWFVTAGASNVTAGVIDDSGSTNTTTVTANKVFAFKMTSAGALSYKNVTDAGSWTSIATGLTGNRWPYGVTAAASWNFGQQPIPEAFDTGFKALCTANLPDGESITTSGTFTGNASADGPYIDIKGVPTTMTINGNAVTFGTHADKTAFGFKVRSSSASYNNAGTNTYSITSTGAKRKYSNAQGNP